MGSDDVNLSVGELSDWLVGGWMSLVLTNQWVRYHFLADNVEGFAQAKYIHNGMPQQALAI
jgi:hypothetical protein